MRSLVLALLVVATPAAAAPLLDDPLDGATSGKSSGGTFVEGGWQTPGQIVWDLGEAVTAGGLEVTLSSWNPDADSPQFTAQRHDIVSLYGAEHASPLLADKDTPKSAYVALRTGTLYGNRLALVSSPGGVEQELETKASAAKGTVAFPTAHTLRVVWDMGGVVAVSLDGQELATHDHHNLLELRYVVVGRNNGPSTTYGSPDGVVVQHVAAWKDDLGETVVLEPTADTWADADHPVLAQGSAPTLQTGGGSVAYVRFAVPDVGTIESAVVELTCMNEGEGGALHRVQDDQWTEAGLTWAMQPAIDPAALASAGFVAVNGKASYDASAAVTGPGVWSFAVVSGALDVAGFHSREGSGPRPRLVLKRAAAPAEDPLSCAGHCGDAAASGCACGAGCVAAGTCCEDACGVCGACPTTGEDAGGPDAGGTDAGSVDAGGGDAGPAHDTGAPDSGDAPADSSDTSGGVVDTGAGGVPIGGGFDAGSGGSVVDDDLVAEPAEEPADGCRTTRGAMPGELLLLALLGLVARFRFQNA